MPSEIVQVENLSASFGEKVVLRDVSFTAYKNQITVILGSSGCGKSTLLKHLIGLYKIKKGQVTIMNEHIDLFDEDEMRAFSLKTGVLFQNGALLNSLTVAENVAIPLEQHTKFPKDIIENLVKVKLELTELPHAAQLFPSQLSGGMRKRAALSRALSLDPPLLFCDEPSAGLDPVTLYGLDQLFLKLKKDLGMTIILITHEVGSIMRLADRIVYLDIGSILFEGSLNEAKESNIIQITDFFSKAGGII